MTRTLSCANTTTTTIMCNSYPENTRGGLQAVGLFKHCVGGLIAKTRVEGCTTVLFQAGCSFTQRAVPLLNVQLGEAFPLWRAFHRHSL